MRTVHKKNVILYAVVFFIIGILSMNLILLFNSSICRWFWFHQEEKQALQEIRLHPSDIDSYRKYFFILIKKGKVDKDKALEYARKIVELSPNDADVLRDAARQIAFYSPNNKEEINKLVNKVLEMTPEKDIISKLGIAQIYETIGESEIALQYYNEVLNQFNGDTVTTKIISPELLLDIKKSIRKNQDIKKVKENL